MRGPREPHREDFRLALLLLDVLLAPRALPVVLALPLWPDADAVSRPWLELGRALPGLSNRYRGKGDNNHELGVGCPAQDGWTGTGYGPNPATHCRCTLTKVGIAAGKSWVGCPTRGGCGSRCRHGAEGGRGSLEGAHGEGGGPGFGSLRGSHLLEKAQKITFVYTGRHLYSGLPWRGRALEVRGLYPEKYHEHADGIM